MIMMKPSFFIFFNRKIPILVDPKWDLLKDS